MQNFCKSKKALKKLMGATGDYMNASDMRSLLKKKDPLIGTPGGALRAYRAREELTQMDLAKKIRHSPESFVRDGKK